MGGSTVLCIFLFIVCSRYIALVINTISFILCGELQVTGVVYFLEGEKHCLSSCVLFFYLSCFYNEDICHAQNLNIGILLIPHSM